MWFLSLFIFMYAREGQDGASINFFRAINGAEGVQPPPFQFPSLPVVVDGYLWPAHLLSNSSSSMPRFSLVCRNLIYFSPYLDSQIVGANPAILTVSLLIVPAIMEATTTVDRAMAASTMGDEEEAEAAGRKAGS
jgi:hypothetical protein